MQPILLDMHLVAQVIQRTGWTFKGQVDPARSKEFGFGCQQHSYQRNDGSALQRSSEQISVSQGL